MLRQSHDWQGNLVRHCAQDLKPVLKAYALGYATSTLPRLPSTVRNVGQARDIDHALRALKATLGSSIGLNRFPTTCAIIVAGSTVLPRHVERLLRLLTTYVQQPALRNLFNALRKNLRLLFAFASAWYAFSLLNWDESWARKRANSRASQLRPMFESPNQHHRPRPMHYAGKTVDFTLFAFCRALDVLVISTWMRTRTYSLHPERTVPHLSRLAKKVFDSWIFATSSAIIMWSWFYSPERLPKTYNQWISKIAEIDSRLIQALRLCREGELVYGKAGSANANLPSLCKELNLPLDWGEPAKTIPIPCELYHCGAGKCCEVHAASRFLRTFLLAFQLYFPLQLVGMLRQKLDASRALQSLRGAARSSSFLASFVTLFYYSVCLARTRLGPKIIPKTIISPQMWDSGLCVLAGCLACGWSLLLEKRSRRQEIAFFVAPRALATLLPRVYDKKYQRREQFLFAASSAIVIDAVLQKNNHVRGVLGRLLQSVLR